MQVYSYLEFQSKKAAQGYDPLDDILDYILQVEWFRRDNLFIFNQGSQSTDADVAIAATEDIQLLTGVSMVPCYPPFL